jgi:hypothetical protein
MGTADVTDAVHSSSAADSVLLVHVSCGEVSSKTLGMCKHSWSLFASTRTMACAIVMDFQHLRLALRLEVDIICCLAMYKKTSSKVAAASAMLRQTLLQGAGAGLVFGVVNLNVQHDLASLTSDEGYNMTKKHVHC